MADQKEEHNELLPPKDLIGSKLDNVIANLQSVQENNLKDTVQYLTSLIRGLYSGSTEKVFRSGKLSLKDLYNQLSSDKDGQIFLKKIQIAYVYYYTLYLSRQSKFREALKRTDRNKNTRALQALFEKPENSEFFKTFQDMLGGSIAQHSESPFKSGAESLKNFWQTANSVVKSKNDDQGNWLNGAENKTANIDGLTVDEILNYTKSTPKTADEAYEIYTVLLKQLKNSSPSQQALGLIGFRIQTIGGLGNPDNPEATFDIALGTDPLLRDLRGTFPYEGAPQNIGATIKSVAENLSKNENGTTPSGAAGEIKASYNSNTGILKLNMISANYFLQKLADALQPKKEQTKKDDNEAAALELDETAENITPDVPLENQLAMNIADYMTGKITAHEFQVRDRRIRNSLPLNSTDQLNEDNEE